MPRFVLLFALLAASAFAQFGSNAASIRGQRLCSPLGPPTDGQTLVWSASANCWNAGAGGSTYTGTPPVVITGSVISVPTAITASALPPCTDVAGMHLNWDSNAQTFGCGSTVGSFPAAFFQWNPGAISDGTCKNNTIYLAQASLGDLTAAGVTPALPSNLMVVSALVSASGIMQIVVCNHSGASQTVALSTWKVAVIK